MNEHALLLPCGQDTLVGVLSLPDAPSNTAVVIVVGGPQYRVGSHRQFVLLARALYADLGFEEIPPYYQSPIAGAHYLKVEID